MLLLLSLLKKTLLLVLQSIGLEEYPHVLGSDLWRGQSLLPRNIWLHLSLRHTFDAHLSRSG